MTIRESFLLAMRSMRATPLRTVLTTLGIAIGVAAVVLLVALGNGVRTGFDRSLSTFSTSVLVGPSPESTPGGNGARVLRDRDAAALSRSSAVPDAVTVVPLVQGSSIIRRGTRQFSGRVNAATGNYLSVFNVSIGAGRMFTADENAQGSQVVVLGPGVVRYLFDNDLQAAVHSEVVIGRATFRVVGTISATPDSDNVVVIPLDTARSSIYADNDKLSQIGLQIVSPDRVEPAIAEIQAVMDRQHRIREPGLRDYTVASQLAQLAKTDAFLDLLTWFTLGVAAIALFVGGLGIANIMLVTVTERTHEIGILKALGSRRGAVVRQFLVEAATISGLGGLLGVGLGVLVTLVGGRLLPQLVAGSAPPELSVLSMVAGFVVSVVIGIVAGTYPAIRGARMRPVEALAH